MKTGNPLAALTLGCLLLATTAVAQTGWILTTDYSTFGNVRSFTGDGPWSVSGDLGTIPGDAVGRHYGGLIYIVGRGTFNLLQVRDPGAGFALVDEFGLGSGLNLQDVVFDAQGEAYLSCYDSAQLLRVDPADGTILGSYSTAAFADADGLPETSWMTAVGDRLYITCQKLDRNNWYLPVGPGALLVFDTVAETWVDMDAGAAGVQPIGLIGANPNTRILVGDGTLTVGCAGVPGLADGGIETVDLATGLSLGYEVTEAALGGDLNRIQRHGADLLAVVNDAAFNTFVARSGPGGVTVLDTGAGFVHADLWVDGDDLYVLDRTGSASGLRVLDAVTGIEQTPGALNTGLPPFVFVLPGRGEVSATPLVASASNLRLAPPYPNPFNPATTVRLEGPADSEVRVEVFDLRGRRVRTAPVRTDGSGSAAYRFDGRDGRGRVLAAGVYLVTARSGGQFASRTVTLVK